MNFLLEKVKGYRTLSLSAIAALYVVAVEIYQFVPQQTMEDAFGPEYRKYVALGYIAIGVWMRFKTTTPVGKNS